MSCQFDKKINNNYDLLHSIIPSVDLQPKRIELKLLFQIKKPTEYLILKTIY